MILKVHFTKCNRFRKGQSENSIFSPVCTLVCKQQILWSRFESRRMVFYPFNDWRYYFKSVWSVSKPQCISLVYSTQNQRYSNLAPFGMETGNSNKITHYCSNKLLNSKFLIWKNSVLSSLFCLLLRGLKSQIILVQWLFHLQRGGFWSWPYLYLSHHFICEWMLEGLSSRPLEELLSNGKHSVVVVALLLLWFSSFPPTVFLKPCNYPD